MGPVSATVAYLLEFQWDPLQPALFATTDRKRVAALQGGPPAVAAVVARFRATVARQLSGVC